MTVIANTGTYRQVVTLSNPGAVVPLSGGSFTQGYVPLSPAQWRCAIETATVRAAEYHFAGTVIAQANYILTGRFHPGISATAPTRMVWTDRAGDRHAATVLDVVDLEGAGVVTIALVLEIVTELVA